MINENDDEDLEEDDLEEDEEDSDCDEDIVKVGKIDSDDSNIGKDIKWW